jgi:hypothetical protein
MRNVADSRVADVDAAMYVEPRQIVAVFAQGSCEETPHEHDYRYTAEPSLLKTKHAQTCMAAHPAPRLGCQRSRPSQWTTAEQC